MNRLGIPQDRIAKRLGMDQKTVHNHLGKMPVLANFLNTDLSQGFTVAQVAQKHGWPVRSKTKPDLIIFDPPYFDKKADGYGEKSISGLPRGEYLEFLGVFFSFLKRNVKKTTLLAFINADWRNFQNGEATKLLAACLGSWCMVNFQLSAPNERHILNSTL